MGLSQAQQDRLLEEFREAVEAAASRVCARIHGAVDKAAASALQLHRERGMTKEQAVQCAVACAVGEILREED